MEKEEGCGQFPSHLRHTPLPSMPHDSNGLMTAAVSTAIQSGDPLLKCVCLCERVNAVIAQHAAMNAE